MLLDKTMPWFAPASGKPGRNPQFSDTAIQFCLTIKTSLDWPCICAVTNGVIWTAVASSFSTLCCRKRSQDVQVAYRASSAGLHLLVDSTGIKFLGEGEWKCKKHRPERRRCT